jgi:hypothetical protein
LNHFQLAGIPADEYDLNSSQHGSVTLLSSPS